MSEIIHYGSFDRGMAVCLGNGLKAVYFGTTPVPFENDTVYVASLDVAKEEDQKRREALEQSKPFKQGKIRYIPSQAELEDKAKQIAENAACEAMKNDLATGIYQINLESLNHEQLVQLADKIGALRNTTRGEKSAPLALRNAIAGRLELEIPYGAPIGNQNAAKKEPELPDVSDVVEEKPKPRKTIKRKKG